MFYVWLYKPSSTMGNLGWFRRVVTMIMWKTDPQCSCRNTGKQVLSRPFCWVFLWGFVTTVSGSHCLIDDGLGFQPEGFMLFSFVCYTTNNHIHFPSSPTSSLHKSHLSSSILTTCLHTVFAYSCLIHAWKQNLCVTRRPFSCSMQRNNQ